MKPVSPGNIGLHDMPGGVGKIGFGIPRPLEVNEIENDIIDRFVYAAKLCQQVGFHGIQLHSAHGYLLSSFLNPRANNRHEIFGKDDKYGGSLENRARLLLTVVKRIKEATRTRRRTAGGDDDGATTTTTKPFAISVKLNTADFQQGWVYNYRSYKSC